MMSSPMTDFKCKLCEDDYSSAQQLRDHLKSSHYCDKCDFVTHNAEELSKHKGTPHEVHLPGSSQSPYEPKTLKCKICESVFEDATELQWHRYQKHKKAVPWSFGAPFLKKTKTAGNKESKITVTGQIKKKKPYQNSIGFKKRKKAKKKPVSETSIEMIDNVIEETGFEVPLAVDEETIESGPSVVKEEPDKPPRKQAKFNPKKDIKMNIDFVRKKLDKVDEDVTNTNPWDVSDASTFLRYCCPDCTFASKTLETFSEHALKSHEGSKILFNKHSLQLLPDQMKSSLDELNDETNELFTHHEQIVQDEEEQEPGIDCSDNEESEVIDVIPEPSEPENLQIIDLIPKPDVSNWNYGFPIVPPKVMEQKEPKPYQMSDEERKEYIKYVMSEEFIGGSKSKYQRQSVHQKRSAKLPTVITKVHKTSNNVVYPNEVIKVENENDSKPVEIQLSSEPEQSVFVYSHEAIIDDNGEEAIITGDNDVEPTALDIPSLTQSDVMTMDQIMSILEKGDIFSSISQKNEHRLTTQTDYLECFNAVEVTETGFKCKICVDAKVLDKKYSVLNHVLKEHVPKHLAYEVCQFCLEIFPNLDQHQGHCNIKHPTAKMKLFQCRQCIEEGNTDFTIKFKTYSGMREHAQLVHQLPHYNVYKCDHCPLEFIFEQELLQHEAEGHQIDHPNLKCDSCVMTFRSRRNLLVHQHCNHGLEQVYLCSHCNFVSNEEGKLGLIEHHFNEHNELRPPYFMCDSCEFIDANLNEVSAHCQNEHNNSDYKGFPCNICNKSYSNISAVNAHKLKVHKKIKSECAYCKDRFDDINDFERHLEENHADVAPKLLCQKCGFSAYSEKLLKVHVNKHSSNGRCKEDVKCPYCDYVTYQTPKLEIHIDWKHQDREDAVNHECPYCHKMFIYKNSCTQHKYSCKLNPDHVNFSTKYAKKHQQKMKDKRTKGEVIDTTCDYCQYRCTSVQDAKDHYLDQHPNRAVLQMCLRKFQCEICREIFINDYKLKRHQSLVHDKRSSDMKFCEICKMDYKIKHTCSRSDVPIECPHCQKTFAEKGNLERHIRDVHGTLAFKCQKCSKRFASQIQMRHHIKYSHEPVTCDICYKSILNKYELKIHHVKVHNIREGAYFCTLCPKSVFFSSKSYELHMRRKH